MKKLLTKKAVRNMNYTILAVGYGDLQYLLNMENEFGYSAGVNGWDCDYYYSPDYEFIISTGYRPVGQKTDYNICKKYDNMAHELIKKHIYGEELKIELQKLMAEFIEEVTK